MNREKHALGPRPDGWVPVFPRDKREAFARRSCLNKKIERDDDSKKSHPALGYPPFAGYHHLKDDRPRVVPGGMPMKSISANFRKLALGIVSALLLAGSANAAEVRVMISGGLTAAYKELVPEFKRLTGNKVLTAYGPSMGTTVNAIPIRLERGEPVDVLIMVGYALGDLVKQGKVVAESRVDLVKSPIGIAVKSGAPKPDISSTDAVKRALLATKSIAYSDSHSGVYVSTEMFEKLGVAVA